MMQTVIPEMVGRLERPGRRLAFRIVASVLGVFTLAFTVPFAATSFTDDTAAIHRLHNLAGVFGFGVMLGGSLLLCAWRPWSIGAFWVAIASGLAGSVAGVLSGDFLSGAWFSAPVAIAILFALHPARRAVLRIDGVDLPTLVLGILALVPAVAFALTQAELQRNGVEADPHVEFHHYSGMAFYALGVPLSGLAASLRVTGRRLGARIAGASGAGLGLASLLLSDHVGAFDALWAWLALAWGVAMVALAELERGRGVS